MADGHNIRSTEGQARWTEGQVLAWTEGDGPGRPPAGSGRGLSMGLAAAMGVVFAGMLATDALCPEHRAWVQGLATVALVGTAAAGIGLARGWAVAPPLTAAVASLGVAIGTLDAVHSVTRGRVLILAFGLLTLGAVLLNVRRARMARWETAVARSMAAITRTATAPTASAPTATAGATSAGPVPPSEPVSTGCEAPSRQERTAASRHRSAVR